LAHRQSPTRASARSTSSALAEFHDLSGHAGDAADCADCADQLARQRQAEAALRAHRRRIRQQIDRILGAGQ
jgi:hypothetical protein